MASAQPKLQEWMVHFLKSRDAFFKKIAAFENKETGLLIKYKDGKEQHVFSVLSLDSAMQHLQSLTIEHHCAIATINSKKNKSLLAEHWKFFSQYKLLTIYFINPFSSGDKKWALMPHVHARICDENNLRAGFNSLSETIPEITEEEFLKNPQSE